MAERKHSMNSGVDYKALGRRVRLARKRKKLSQKKLADIASVSPAHISNIECAHGQASLPTLLSVANALDTTVDHLLCDNLENAKNIYENEILLETKDCSETEIRIMAEMVRSLKQAMRTYPAELDKTKNAKNNNNYYKTT